MLLGSEDRAQLRSVGTASLGEAGSHPRHGWVEVGKAVSGSPETQQDASHIQLLHDFRGCFPPGPCLGCVWDKIFGGGGLTHHTGQVWVFHSVNGGLLNLLKPSPSSEEWGTSY